MQLDRHQQPAPHLMYSPARMLARLHMCKLAGSKRSTLLCGTDCPAQSAADCCACHVVQSGAKKRQAGQSTAPARGVDRRTALTGVEQGSYLSGWGRTADAALVVKAIAWLIVRSMICVEVC
jgi:hypothetical protein